MEQLIRKLCHGIEAKHRVRILFAVENGSRAWRMASADSDYDVRFVYARPAGEYLRLHVPPDVITAAFDGEGKPHPVQGALIDMSGFDVFKFARLLASSNPTTLEWLVSDIVYVGHQPPAFVQFATSHFNPAALYFHYKSMCRNNYVQYLKSRLLVTHKKYLYAYRGLLNARWVATRSSVPPIVFGDVLAGLSDSLPSAIVARLRMMLDAKAQSAERQAIGNIPEMDDFIEDFLRDDTEAPAPRGRPDTSALDAELRRIVLAQTSAAGG